MNESANRRLLRILMQVGFALAIVVTIWLSLVPASQVPFATRVSDSVSHFVGYATLGFLAVGSGLRWRTGFTVVFALGVFLEVLQSFVGYRYFEIKDIVVNGLGAAAGVGIGSLFVVKFFTTYRYRHR